MACVCSAKEQPEETRGVLGKTEGWMERPLAERTGVTRGSPFSRAQAELTRERAASQVRVTRGHTQPRVGRQQNRALERHQSWGRCGRVRAVRRDEILKGEQLGAWRARRTEAATLGDTPIPRGS